MNRKNETTSVNDKITFLTLALERGRTIDRYLATHNTTNKIISKLLRDMCNPNFSPTDNYFESLTATYELSSVYHPHVYGFLHMRRYATKHRHKRGAILENSNVENSTHQYLPKTNELENRCLFKGLHYAAQQLNNDASKNFSYDKMILMKKEPTRKYKRKRKQTVSDSLLNKNATVSDDEEDVVDNTSGIYSE